MQLPRKQFLHYSTQFHDVCRMVHTFQIGLAIFSGDVDG